MYITYEPDKNGGLVVLDPGRRTNHLELEDLTELLRPYRVFLVQGKFYFQLPGSYEDSFKRVASLVQTVFGEQSVWYMLPNGEVYCIEPNGEVLLINRSTTTSAYSP